MSDRVTVEQFAAHVGLAPDGALAWWRSLGLVVEPDWAGRLSIAEPDAGRAFTAFVEERNRVLSERQASETAADAERERVRVREQSIMDRVQETMRGLGLAGPAMFAAATTAVRRVRDGQDEDRVVAEVVAEARSSVQTIAGGVL